MKNYPNHNSPSNWLNIVFGLFVVALVAAVIAIFFGFIVITPQPRNSLQYRAQIANHEQSDPTPTSASIYLPLISKPQTDPIAEWKTYENATYRYSFKYPSDWDLTLGNKADPILPEDAVTVSKGRFNAIVLVVEKISLNRSFSTPLFEHLSRGAKAIDSGGFQNRQQLRAERAEIIQEGMENTQLKTIYTSFNSGGYVYSLYTTFRIDPKTEKPLDAEREEELKVYNLVVASFAFKEIP